MLQWRHQRKGFIAVKIAYIRPDTGVPANDPSLIREVDRVGTIRYRNSDDQLHREDGPAYECPDGSRMWYLDGKRHREDGPAVERSDGTHEWYLDGKRLSKGEFEVRKPATRWATHQGVVLHRLKKVRY